MSTHTPGPWQVVGSNVYGNNLRALLPMNAADARLIAAAPEMLEALELADAMLSGANMNASVVERKVRAAIAKARGEK
jgi:hypothetical protein